MTPPTFYGWKNYERLVTDTKFMKALFNTIKINGYDRAVTNDFIPHSFCIFG